MLGGEVTELAEGDSSEEDPDPPEESSELLSSVSSSTTIEGKSPIFPLISPIHHPSSTPLGMRLTTRI